MRFFAVAQNDIIVGAGFHPRPFIRERTFLLGELSMNFIDCLAFEKTKGMYVIHVNEPKDKK